MKDLRLFSLLEDIKDRSKPVSGGETCGRKLLKQIIKDKTYVKTFQKPKTNPVAIPASTTLLSAYIAHGCISVYEFFTELQNI